LYRRKLATHPLNCITKYTIGQKFIQEEISHTLNYAEFMGRNYKQFRKKLQNIHLTS